MVTLSKPKVVKEFPFAGARNRFYTPNDVDSDELAKAYNGFVRFFFHLEPRRRQSLMEILNALNDVQETLEDHTHVKADITDLETITTTPTADAVPKADGSGDLADGWIPASAVTQHEAALSIAGPQVDSGILPDARIQVTGVTQHQASISEVSSHVGVGGTGVGDPGFGKSAAILRARLGDDSGAAGFSAATLSSDDWVDTLNEYRIGATKVLGVGQGGWGDPSGTETRTTFDTTTVTTEQLAERVHALIDDLRNHHQLLTS